MGIQVYNSETSVQIYYTEQISKWMADGRRQVSVGGEHKQGGKTKISHVILN